MPGVVNAPQVGGQIRQGQAGKDDGAGQVQVPVGIGRCPAQADREDRLRVRLALGVEPLSRLGVASTGSKLMLGRRSDQTVHLVSDCMAQRTSWCLTTIRGARVKAQWC
ncbi:hypothetical protein GCM10023176_34680 [Micromonospora coerulea]|uniref:Uncharacterized protein n=1 Tax=Micromonospora coerulea TaxID=47856 RepID=A0ABP8SPQ5_9ACTN